MLDQFGRNIDYVRLSLTEACNLHCQYCRPPRLVTQGAEPLSYEELLRFAKILVGLGFKKFKITGGEPLVRQGCLSFLERLRPLAEQLTLTTNGTLLGGYVKELAALGLDGLNISLDSCNAERYAELTGSRWLPRVLEAITSARGLGLAVKLNCVPVKPFGRAELSGLLDLAMREGLPLRFIELMPLSCNAGLASLNGAELRALFKELGYVLQPSKLVLGNGPAAYYEAKNMPIAVGFIEPLHGKFCSQCNRLRLTATGFVKPCLYSKEGLDVAALLRSGASDEAIEASLKELILHKPREHAFEKRPAGFSMNTIGG